MVIRFTFFFVPMFTKDLLAFFCGHDFYIVYTNLLRFLCITYLQKLEKLITS